MNKVKLQFVLETLQFYADPKNWKSNSTGFSRQYDPRVPAVLEDHGKMARDTLEILTYEEK